MATRTAIPSTRRSSEARLPVARRARPAADEPVTRRTRAAPAKSGKRASSKRDREPRVNRFADIKPCRDKFSTTSLYQYISDHAEVDKRVVKDVLQALTRAMVSSIKPRGPGVFTIPGLLRVKTRHKPAVKGGKKVNNPFKPGETMITKDRPARTIVKILPSKDFKESANR